MQRRLCHIVHIDKIVLLVFIQFGTLIESFVAEKEENFSI